MLRGWASSSRPAGCRSPTRWLNAGGDGPTGRGAETGSTRSRKCSRSSRPLLRSTISLGWWSSGGRMWASASRVRRVGADALDEHWTGNEVGLAAIRRMAGSAVPERAAIAGWGTATKVPVAGRQLPRARLRIRPLRLAPDSALWTTDAQACGRARSAPPVVVAGPSGREPGGQNVEMVRRLGGEEFADAVRPLVRAFWSDPETLHLLPNERDRRHVLPRYLLSDVRDAVGFDMLFGAESADGQLVGAAAWIPPEAYPVTAGRQLRQAVGLAPSLPWGWRAPLEARRGQAANRARHRIHPPHFYLRAIGVDPASQARSVGTSLMEPALRVADDRSVGCFLQTVTDANVAFYRQFGFRVVDEYHPTTRWPLVQAMWRDPLT